jgi:hypothetical protein
LIFFLERYNLFFVRFATTRGNSPVRFQSMLGGLKGIFPMIQITEGRNCEICAKNEAVVICNGCGKALCVDCRIFDLWYCGCGHANSVAFCRKCDADPAINTWKTSE